MFSDFCNVENESMHLSIPLITVWIYLSEAALLPLNSSILQLPSHDAILATAEPGTNKSLIGNPWPFLPFQRRIKDGLSIRITGYGDLLTKKQTNNVLEALLRIQGIIENDGEDDDVLEETTTVGVFRGSVYAEVGFYSLHPPAGIQRLQASEVLHKVWQLVIEYSPAREIPSSIIFVEGQDVALFRLSFRPR